MAGAETRAEPERASPSWGAIVAIWSVVAWLMVFNMETAAYINGDPLPPWRALVPALAEWYLWVPLTPIVLWAGARFPAWQSRSLRAYLPHVLGVVGITVLRGAVYAGTTMFIARTPMAVALPVYLFRITVGFLPIAAALYIALLSYGAATEYARRSRAGELRTAQLETMLAQSELAALRSSLHPHFLFNALHCVGALVRTRDHDGAVRVIAELGELLRYLLRRGAADEVPLRDELAFARRYLAIEQVRFQDRLSIEWNVAPELEEAIVPRLVLQPLVDNAVRHGIARSSTAGHIMISSERHGAWLEIAVSDDGPGVAPQARTSASDDVGGLGLVATRLRLQQAYGDEAGVTLSTGARGGTTATVRVPYHPNGVAARNA